MKIKMTRQFKKNCEVFVMIAAISFIIGWVDRKIIGAILFLFGTTVFLKGTPWDPDSGTDENETVHDMELKDSKTMHLALGGSTVEIKDYQGGIFVGKVAQVNSPKVMKGYLLLHNVRVLRRDWDDDVGDLKSAIRQNDNKVIPTRYFDINMIDSIDTV